MHCSMWPHHEFVVDFWDRVWQTGQVDNNFYFQFKSNLKCFYTAELFSTSPQFKVSKQFFCCIMTTQLIFMIEKLMKLIQANNCFQKLCDIWIIGKKVTIFCTFFKHPISNASTLKDWSLYFIILSSLENDLTYCQAVAD